MLNDEEMLSVIRQREAVMRGHNKLVEWAETLQGQAGVSALSHVGESAEAGLSADAGLSRQLQMLELPSCPQLQPPDLVALFWLTLPSSVAGDPLQGLPEICQKGVRSAQAFFAEVYIIVYDMDLEVPEGVVKVASLLESRDRGVVVARLLK